MQRLDSQLAVVDHETILVRGESAWSGVEQVLAEREMDLLIESTHGWTGEMTLGSVAEEIFRSEGRAFHC